MTRVHAEMFCFESQKRRGTPRAARRWRGPATRRPSLPVIAVPAPAFDAREACSHSAVHHDQQLAVDTMRGVHTVGRKGRASTGRLDAAPQEERPRRGGAHSAPPRDAPQKRQLLSCISLHARATHTSIYDMLLVIHSTHARAARIPGSLTDRTRASTQQSRHHRRRRRCVLAPWSEVSLPSRVVVRP